MLVSVNGCSLVAAVVDVHSELVNGQGRMGFRVNMAYGGRALANIFSSFGSSPSSSGLSISMFDARLAGEPPVVWCHGFDEC
jgi:hypothetical protein